MVAAVFFLDSWAGHNEYFLEGEDASDLLTQFEEVQDLSCIVHMGRMNGEKKDQKELDKLEELLEKHQNGDLEMSDLKGFSIDVSVGKMGVLATAETDEEIGSLRK